MDRHDSSQSSGRKEQEPQWGERPMDMESRLITRSNIPSGQGYLQSIVMQRPESWKDPALPTALCSA